MVEVYVVSAFSKGNQGDSCINQREEVCQKRDTPLQ